MKVRQYPATLNRVVDGDTVILKTDLGFHVFSDICFRLARINCPEMGTPKAQEAKAFTQKFLEGKTLWVESAKGDKYGRWIGDVYEKGKTEFLSDCLLRAGLAEPYPKPKVVKG